jgi:hypothetical protein
VRAESVAEAGSCVSEAQVRAGRPGLIGCASGGGVVQCESAAEADSCVSAA